MKYLPLASLANRSSTRVARLMVFCLKSPHILIDLSGLMTGILWVLPSRHDQLV